jgi:hypothetical protein
MPDVKQLPPNNGNVLWTAGPVCCTCLRFPPDRIVICLFSKELMIDTRTFTSEDEASDYATTLMRAYGAR